MHSSHEHSSGLGLDRLRPWGEEPVHLLLVETQAVLLSSCLSCADAGEFCVCVQQQSRGKLSCIHPLRDAGQGAKKCQGLGQEQDPCCAQTLADAHSPGTCCTHSPLQAWCSMQVGCIAWVHGNS